MFISLRKRVIQYKNKCSWFSKRIHRRLLQPKWCSCPCSVDAQRRTSQNVFSNKFGKFLTCMQYQFQGKFMKATIFPLFMGNGKRNESGNMFSVSWQSQYSWRYRRSVYYMHDPINMIHDPSWSMIPINIGSSKSSDIILTGKKLWEIN
jgi:hypothetical protein